MSTSNIQWTNRVWNPVTGCQKISQGCKNCYAERMHKRLMAMGQEKYSQPFSKVVCHPSELQKPLGWTKPSLIFVNSMSDLFHEDVPFQFISDLFEVMELASWHQFQVLTKRPERALEMADKLFSPHRPNIWFGVSVENEETMHRVDTLRKIDGAQVRFLSCEPLLGPLDNLNLQGIHWVIVGGESGKKARKMQEDWAIGIKNTCEKAGVPFFFKQWGGAHPKSQPALLQGKKYEAMPCNCNFNI